MLPFRGALSKHSLGRGDFFCFSGGGPSCLHCSSSFCEGRFENTAWAEVNSFLGGLASIPRGVFKTQPRQRSIFFGWGLSSTPRGVSKTQQLSSVIHVKRSPKKPNSSWAKPFSLQSVDFPTPRLVLSVIALLCVRTQSSSLASGLLDCRRVPGLTSSLHRPGQCSRTCGCKCRLCCEVWHPQATPIGHWLP